MATLLAWHLISNVTGPVSVQEISDFIIAIQGLTLVVSTYQFSDYRVSARQQQSSLRLECWGELSPSVACNFFL